MGGRAYFLWPAAQAHLEPLQPAQLQPAWAQRGPPECMIEFCFLGGESEVWALAECVVLCDDGQSFENESGLWTTHLAGSTSMRVCWLVSRLSKRGSYRRGWRAGGQAIGRR